jgi:undecaprenyl-diphosphatase
MDAATKTLPSFVRQRLDPEQRFGLRLTLFAVAIILVFVPFGLLLSQVVDEGPLTVYDRALAEDLHEIVRDQPWTVTPLEVLSFLGKPIWFYLLVGVAGAYLLWRGRRRLLAYLVLTGIGGGLVDTVVKEVVSRDRPKLEDPVATAWGMSFPSGHAFTSTAMYGALLLVFMPAIPKRFRPVAIAAYATLVTAIAFSRLALGVHFLTDVVGGILLGAAWLAAATAAFSIWRAERGRKPVEPARGLEPEAAKDLKPTA